MVVSFETHFRKLHGRDPAVVFAADLILDHFDLRKAEHFDFGETGVDADGTLALQDFDSVDPHRVDGFDRVHTFDPFHDIVEESLDADCRALCEVGIFELTSL